MHFAPRTLRLGIGFAAALLLGYTARTLQGWIQAGLTPVQAQARSGSSSLGSEALSFQLNSAISSTSGLTIYNPADHTLYVYQNVTGGNSHVNCSFSIHIGHLGGPVDRQNCPIGNAF